MGINEVIVYLMLAFAVLGALDKIIGNRFELGEKFEEGIMAIGALSLSMVGMIVLAPVLANVLSPVVVPVFEWIGADPGMFAGCILANDMGGAPLAAAMAQTTEAGQFGGLIVGSMLGATVVFTIPAALGIIKKEDRSLFAMGTLSGVITIPIGAFAGGLAAGYPVVMVVRNLIPIVIVAVLVTVGLLFAQNAMITGFSVFGKGIVVLVTIGLIAGIVEKLTGRTILPGANPIGDGFAVVADIAIVLAGAFPLVHVLTKVLKKPLAALGKLLHINEASVAGLIASLANNIPMFGLMKDMNPRGKVLNAAFAVSAAFVFGDHLGFTAGYAKEMIAPVIVGKLVGGITAVAVALLLTGAKKFKDTEGV